MWRGEYTRGLISLFLTVAFVVGACAESAAPEPDSTTTDAESTSTTTDVESTTSSGQDVSDTTQPDNGAQPTSRPPDDCDIPAGEPFIETQSVELIDLGEIDGAQVRVAMYPHPDYEGELWSQWGQGIVLEDGRFFSAIGDHAAPDGNSYVYEYDPSTNTLTMVGDVLSYVDHVPGTWGYGKIHSQMVPGPCGEIYFSTYWGSYRDIEFEGNYTGDLLFRLDPFGRTMQPLSVPVEYHGQASLAAYSDSGLIYGEAIDPVGKDVDDENRGPFFAYDVVTEEVVHIGPDEPHVGFRSILVDSAGTAYYSIGDGKMRAYHPETGESSLHPATLPGEYLRAATDPASDGSVYGLTDDPEHFFVMRPDGSIEELGEAIEYTASIALSPDGSSIYYMPGAHGDAPEWNSPLMRVDTETGEQEVVVELNDAIQEEFGFMAGGTYSVSISPDGDTVYMGVNGGEVGSEQESFGEVFLIVIELP